MQAKTFSSRPNSGPMLSCASRSCFVLCSPSFVQPSLSCSSLMSVSGLPLVAPKITPVLDPAFRPAVLANRQFQKAAEDAPGSVPVVIGLEQADGSVFHYRTRLVPAGHP